MIIRIDPHLLGISLFHPLVLSRNRGYFLVLSDHQFTVLLQISRSWSRYYIILNALLVTASLLFQIDYRIFTALSSITSVVFLLRLSLPIFRGKFGEKKHSPEFINKEIVEEKLSPYLPYVTVSTVYALIRGFQIYVHHTTSPVVHIFTVLFSLASFTFILNYSASRLNYWSKNMKIC